MTCFGILSRSKGLKPNLTNNSDLTLISDEQSVNEKAIMTPLDEKVDTTERLEKLRQLMEEEGVHAYIVPSVDAHGSEYVPPEARRREFISGCTADVGTAVVCKDSAHLFVDGRFYIQAEKQLDKNWTLHKVPIVPDYNKWLIEEARKNGKGFSIGVDPTLIGYAIASDLLDEISPLGASLTYPSRNLIDVVWADKQPKPIEAQIQIHPLQFAGKRSQEKLKELADWVESGGSDKRNPIPRGSAIILNQLDQIAWLLNLRGASIPNNPFFPAYVVVSAGEETYRASIFVPSSLLSKDSDAYRYLVDELRVDVQEYDAVFKYLIEGSWKGPGDDQKLVISDQASWAIVNAVGVPNVYSVLRARSPVELGKAIKNDVEIEGMRKAYLRDGVCWAKWASWLDEKIRVHHQKINERDAVDALVAIREKAENYGGMEAYDGISASGENAALPHYQTPEHGSKVIDRNTPYLCDSGAQYLDGTIDTTRTVHFGKPTKEQKRAFTRVLQGHIAIDTVTFPRNTTTGATLDVIARTALWSDGYNYMHGTGHGIGSFGAVHEGPQGFSTSSGGSSEPIAFQPNMVVTNEPGYYEEGNFGIRTESLLVVRPAPKTHFNQNGEENWLHFERLTTVPISTDLIDWKLLSADQKYWIKKHNKDVYDKLTPFLKHDKRAQRWLKRQLV
ncbi:Creatinase/aminopeptidase [Meira miltonrushii]|uniref:Creatinase/aminopeptidase n=1 Tax=Meira miltonrushii TaxID=1280837 RepID=A0A316V914_9BASI|nr:Creatinase/aminopeptidase [Meira miltonrushii]PWN33528.1 Creatinase/aminopeptidase [Meira miltonrushii]